MSAQRILIWLAMVGCLPRVGWHPAPGEAPGVRRAGRHAGNRRARNADARVKPPLTDRLVRDLAGRIVIAFDDDLPSQVQKKGRLPATFGAKLQMHFGSCSSPCSAPHSPFGMSRTPVPRQPSVQPCGNSFSRTASHWDIVLVPLVLDLAVNL